MPRSVKVGERHTVRPRAALSCYVAPPCSTSCPPRLTAISMPTRITNDPNHWRERAAKMRELARTMTDAQSAILMNDLEKNRH
jgi:hypothetical protein